MRVSAKELLLRAFHSFLRSFLNGPHSYFPPYFALSLPLPLKATAPLYEL